MKILIPLTDAQRDRLLLPVQGSGGWQSLLRKLQKRIQDSHVELTTEDVGRILRYAQDYGQGGFQNRLDGVVKQSRILAKAILEALRMEVPEELQAKSQARLGESTATNRRQQSQTRKEEPTG